MKKILIVSVAVVLALCSCTKFENCAPAEKLPVPSVTVVVTAVADSAFTFTITPEEGTGYYSYTVLEGPELPLDSMSVFKVEYGGIAEGTQSKSKVPSVTKTLSPKNGIVPNTVYTVYAVAANSQDLVSPVKAATVLTTDHNKLYPVKVTPDAQSASVTVEFNQDLYSGSADAKAYAHYFRVWGDSGQTPIDIEIPAKTIVLDGAKMTLTAPDTINGAYVFFTWDRGLVVSSADTLCPAYNTCKFVSKEGKIVTDSTGSKGIYSRWPVGSFGLTRAVFDESIEDYVRADEDSVIAFTSLMDTTSGITEFEYAIVADSTLVAGALKDITVSYKNSKKVTSYISCNYFCYTTYGNSDTLIYMFCNNEAPSQGDFLKYSIEADTFEDVWGNYNKPYRNEEDNFLYSYGYSVDDFCGTFEISQYSVYGEFDYADTVTISKGKDDTVLVSGLGVHNGYLELQPSSKPIKGVVDCDLGTLTISNEEIIGKADWTAFKLPIFDVAVCDCNDDGDPLQTLQFSMQERDSYVLPGEYITFIGYPEKGDEGVLDYGYVYSINKLDPHFSSVKAKPMSAPIPPMFDKSMQKYRKK